MLNIPECLEPALEAIQNFETKIAALDGKNQNLDESLAHLKEEKESLESSLKEALHNQEEQKNKFDTERITLRELNVVVSEQLRDKVEALNNLNTNKSELESENEHYKSLHSELSEKHDKVHTEHMLVSAGHDALSVKSDEMNNELEMLRAQNQSLKEEVSALTLVNSAMHQRQSDLAGTQSNEADTKELENELKALKAQLANYTDTNSDEGFLRSENERLIHRHGEITQEKMQASAKMHTAQNTLNEVQTKLESAEKNIKQLEFDHQGLQNLHSNLTQERDSLLDDNSDLVSEKSSLEEKIGHLNGVIQTTSTEKEMVTIELTQERAKADAMIEEVNHLRLKSRTLAEDIKNLKEGAVVSIKDDNFEPEVRALEIDESPTAALDIEIVDSSVDRGPHYPGAFHANEENK